jgi:thiosulfate reductase cytochrome b subunit
MTTAKPQPANGDFTLAPRSLAHKVLRHRWPIRVMHWINLIALTVMLGSGLQIFNASPSLHWGNWSDPQRQWLALDAYQAADGSAHGTTQIGSHRFDTTGMLGVSNMDGQPQARAFPAWATIPGPQWLAMGRRWHFFFGWIFVINGLCYLGYSLASRHLQRDLLPNRGELRGIGGSIRDHLRLRHPEGTAALRYNVLQKLTYLLVIFVLGGGIVLMGLLMSPRMDALLAPVLELVGGRQSARSIHFILAFGFIAFALVHVLMVLLSGPANQLRGMITGYYEVHLKPKPSAAPHSDTNAAGQESTHD